MGQILSSLLALILSTFIALDVFGLSALAQSRESLSDVIDDTYDCQLIKPMVAQTDESPTRVGAILNGIAIDQANGKRVALRLNNPLEICTPDYPVPAKPPATWQLTNYTFSRTAGASFNIELAKLLNLAKFDFSYLDEVDFGITEPVVYLINSELRRQGVRQIYNKPDCRPAFKTKPAQVNYINYPILITNTCVGKVNFNFAFNRGVDGSVLALQIAQIKLGLSFNVGETLGREVPCPTGSGQSKPSNPAAAQSEPSGSGAKRQPKSTAGAASSSKPSGAAGPNATAGSIDQAAKQGISNVTKLLSDYATKVAAVAQTKATTAEQTGAPDAAAKKEAAAEAKTAADQAKQSVQSPATVTIPTAGKCYQGMTLSSTSPVVFGVQYHRADLYLPSPSP